MKEYMFNSKLLLDLIKKNGLTKKQFCADLHLSPTTLANMQTNESYDIGAKRLLAIAEYFSVPMDYFFNREVKVPTVGHSVNGNDNNVSGDIIMSQQAIEIEHLKEMLKEKERTIQILMER